MVIALSSLFDARRGRIVFLATLAAVGETCGGELAMACAPTAACTVTARIISIIVVVVVFALNSRIGEFVVVVVLVAQLMHIYTCV